MEPSATLCPRLYRCDYVDSQRNIQTFVKWCSQDHRSHEQIMAVLEVVFALRHLSRTETDVQWCNMVYAPRMPLFRNYWMTTLPCKVQPCERCNRRQGGTTFQYIGPWTPAIMVGALDPARLPIFLDPPRTWQLSAVGQAPWIHMTEGDVRSFDLIDQDLRSPLVEDVVDDVDESAEELSSLTEEDEPNTDDVIDC